MPEVINQWLPLVRRDVVAIRNKVFSRMYTPDLYFYGRSAPEILQSSVSLREWCNTLYLFPQVRRRQSGMPHGGPAPQTDSICAQI
jgi:hypothetical protein